MRIATTLMLGAALMAGASAAGLAQDSGSRPLPAVPALASAKPGAVKADSAKPVTQEAAVTMPAKAADAADTAPTAAPADPQGADAKDDKPAVQEAKNNDAGLIDATADKIDSDSIVATVNDESISDYELRQRVALYLALNGITQQLTAEQHTRIRNQILEVLESEKLQLQEAVKKKITVSPVEVDKRLNAMMQDYHFTIDQLRQNLAKAGASEDALRSQITASIAWQKTVQDEYGDDVNITPATVDAELARYAEGANKPHYHVLEIFLPVDNPEQNDKVKKDAEEVEHQLHQGAPFPVVARQFSQHPTAATGGDMGWVNTGQLAPELDSALAKMEAGAISDPIRSTGGWYVLGLRERQEPLGTKIADVPTGPTGPAGTLPLARLLFPVGGHPPKDQLEQIMTVANQIQQHYAGCGQLDELHNKMTGTVYMDLGDAKLSDLSPQIQDAMKSTRPGEAAAPFLSEAGIELIGRCDKRIEVKTAYVMPTRQQVEDQLFQNQIATLARRYLRDLKRDANIQVRDNSKPDALIR
ncbi:MAG TPA: peptidylprolyl isomerase [Rhizomicrobium sp.]|jgi:peptidyl-prolyl cis-trans isomerase SurA|nr:peptidylprolyl isomerase [Rhizomicrobium sp.]